MEFNIKGMSPWSWAKIGVVAVFIIAMLIFKPDFDAHPTLVYSVAGIIGAWLLYEFLKMTGILGKIFNKK